MTSPASEPPDEYVRLNVLLDQLHADGRPNSTAYVAGHCHILAVALQQRGVGDIVMLTPYGEPESPQHFGVHKDGVVTDAYGHFTVSDWVEGWNRRFPTFDFEPCAASRGFVERITAGWDDPRPIDRTSLSAAGPLADALIATADLPLSIWNIDPDTRIRSTDQDPPNVGATWRKATSRPTMPPSSPMTVLPEPTESEMRWAMTPREDRVVDARGRFVMIDRSLEPRDPRPTVDELDAYGSVRRAQAQIHPSGRTSHSAFTRGRCHVLAAALQDEMGGDLVVMTPSSDPSYLIHAGILVGDVACDGEGHHPSGGWLEMWRNVSQEPNLAVRTVDRAELANMVSHTDRPLDDKEIEAALPLARALSRAAALPHQVWNAVAPGVSERHGEREPRPAEAWSAAMSRNPLPTLPPLRLDADAPSIPSTSPLAIAAVRATQEGARTVSAIGPAPSPPIRFDRVGIER